MKTFNQSYTRYLAVTKDDSAANTTLGKELINDLEIQVLADKNWPFLERERTASTVANQQSYRLPPDYGRWNNIKVSVNSVSYTPLEVLSYEEWNVLNETVITSDIPTRFFIFGDYVRIYPIPSSSGNTITLSYSKDHKEMTVADYSTGTITSTAGSRTITGSGTTFTSAMAGRWIKVVGRWYEIQTFVSTTSLTLYKAAIATSSGATYNLGEMPVLPSAFHDMLWQGATATYFLSKGNHTDYKLWQDKFNYKLSRLHSRFGEKTDAQYIYPSAFSKRKFHSLLRTPSPGSLS
tara:strand:- start:5736 stop:6614 length:879 start_codon:yes stop_codon:yes gene_type:complete